MKVTKGHAFLIACLLIVLLTAFMVMVVALQDRANVVLSIAGAAIAGLVSVAIGFIGGNVVDNGVKGKYYQEKLDK